MKIIKEVSIGLGVLLAVLLVVGGIILFLPTTSTVPSNNNFEGKALFASGEDAQKAATGGDVKALGKVTAEEIASMMAEATGDPNIFKVTIVNTDASLKEGYARLETAELGSDPNSSGNTSVDLAPVGNFVLGAATAARDAQLPMLIGIGLAVLAAIQTYWRDLAIKNPLEWEAKVTDAQAGTTPIEVIQVFVRCVYADSEDERNAFLKLADTPKECLAVAKAQVSKRVEAAIVTLISKSTVESAQADLLEWLENPTVILPKNGLVLSSIGYSGFHRGKIADDLANQMNDVMHFARACKALARELGISDEEAADKLNTRNLSMQGSIMHMVKEERDA